MKRPPWKSIYIFAESDCYDKDPLGGVSQDENGRWSWFLFPPPGAHKHCQLWSSHQQAENYGGHKDFESPEEALVELYEYYKQEEG